MGRKIESFAHRTAVPDSDNKDDIGRTGAVCKSAPEEISAGIGCKGAVSAANVGCCLDAEAASPTVFWRT
jgi:hypothetical protein